jgi:hypothetical protein
MGMDLVKALNISASGLKAQGTRLRVISENIANAESTAQIPGGEPYRRKVVTFGSLLDRELGMETVRVSSVKPDRSDFGRRYDPGHPAADETGDGRHARGPTQLRGQPEGHSVIPDDAAADHRHSALIRIRGRQKGGRQGARTAASGGGQRPHGSRSLEEPVR